MGVLLYFCGVAFGHVNTLTLPVHRTHLSFTRRSVLNRLSLDLQKAGASITARLYYSIESGRIKTKTHTYRALSAQQNVWFKFSATSSSRWNSVFQNFQK